MIDTAHSPQIPVKRSAPEVFRIVFPSSGFVGSVSWYDFENAMEDAGFTIKRNGGSMVKFCDRSGLDPLTMHSPHHSRIEGHMLRVVSGRLKNVMDGTMRPSD